MTIRILTIKNKNIKQAMSQKVTHILKIKKRVVYLANKVVIVKINIKR